jgi:hypothetical protein
MSGDAEDTFHEDSRRDEERARRARGALSIPATLLIVDGVLGLLMALLALVQLPSMPEKFDNVIKTIENDQAMAKEQKDFWVELFTWMKDLAEERTPLLIGYGVNIAVSVLIIFGGISMLRLSGPAIPILSSVISMIPCITPSCCCVLGLLAGIWSLVVLSRPEVRAAMSRRATSGFSNEPNAARE